MGPGPFTTKAGRIFVYAKTEFPGRSLAMNSPCRIKGGPLVQNRDLQPAGEDTQSHAGKRPTFDAAPSSHVAAPLRLGKSAFRRASPLRALPGNSALVVPGNALSERPAWRRPWPPRPSRRGGRKKELSNPATRESCASQNHPNLLLALAAPGRTFFPNSAQKPARCPD